MAFAIFITSILVIGLLLMSASRNNTLFWDVEEGDEFTFSIVYHLQMNDSLTDPEYLNAWREPLNDTVVIFRVDDLPEIPQIVNSVNFIEAIFNHAKSNCRFENGTEISEPYKSKLNNLFSRYLLPVGDWEFIDSLFMDYFDFNNIGEEMRYEYLAWSNDDYFYMSYIGMSTSEIRGSFCTIDMNTGMILMMEDSIETFDSSGFAFCDITLIATE